LGINHHVVKRAEMLCVGIDELSRQNGHVYVTNVYDKPMSDFCCSLATKTT